ncbi:MAG TPA: hypothetical protein VFV19_07110 [Candidatus Polarisedimenticolaceae bacterium]|nr:hypothetical protein [Candidatus Polarisedimenticolaceae bacterium]
MNGSAIALIVAAGSFSLFGFLAVTTWTDARRREREAYYRSETLKKLAETTGAGGTTAIELFKEQERAADRRRREAMRLGGLVTFAAGVGIWVFLMNVARDQDVQFAGLIPMLIGMALLLYGYILAPLQERYGGGGAPPR